MTSQATKLSTQKDLLYLIRAVDVKIGKNRWIYVHYFHLSNRLCNISQVILFILKLLIRIVH
jgi:hypothetical protein